MTCRHCQRSDADTVGYTANRRETALCGRCARRERENGVKLIPMTDRRRPARSSYQSVRAPEDAKMVAIPRVRAEYQIRAAQQKARGIHKHNDEKGAP